MEIFKKIISLLFLLAFIVQSFGSTFLLADYYTNKADYIKNCINKNKPILRCKGKCQLMKKMAEQEKKEKDNLEKKEGLKLSVLSSKSFFNCLELIQINHYLLHFSVESNAHTTDRSNSIFHPPCLA